MSYRRFKISESPIGSATLATFATVQDKRTSSVANVASVARPNLKTESGVVINLADWQAMFDERAGIREFDGGFPRAEAERLAQEDTIAVLGPEPDPGRAALGTCHTFSEKLKANDGWPGVR